MKPPTTAGQVGLNCPKCGENLSRAMIAKSHPIGGGQFRRRYCPRCHAGVDSIETVKGVESKVLIIDVTDLTVSERRTVNAVIREFRRARGTYDEWTCKLKRDAPRGRMVDGDRHEPDCDCIVCDGSRPPKRPEPMFEG